MRPSIPRPASPSPPARPAALPRPPQPTEVQKEKLGLRKAWGSPNGAMRRGSGSDDGALPEIEVGTEIQMEMEGGPSQS